ncbi:MAG: heparinase II/III family protein [Fibrobacteres bacterium]|nr:heparinase II/III family protein [Fibrobacterota bacterium]
MVAAQTPPAIKLTRPRIWIAAERFEWLKLHKDSGDCKKAYQNVNNAYYGWWINDTAIMTGAYLEGSDSTKWKLNLRNSNTPQMVMMTVMFIKMETDTNSEKRLRFIAEKYCDYVDTCIFSNIEYWTRETVYRNFSMMGSIILDWCKPSLSQIVQDRLTHSLYKLTKEFMTTFVLTSAGNGYVSSHNANNCLFCIQNVFALNGEASLTSGRQDTLKTWYNLLWDKWVNGFFKCYAYYRDDDGGWNWGAGYARWGIQTQYSLFDNVLYATGKNLYSELPWIKSIINQWWYYYLPDNSCIHFGDEINRAEADNALYRHAAVFGDTRSKWLVQKYTQAKYLTWTIPWLNMLLYRDFQASFVAMPDVPLDWWADKVGFSVNRSSWDSSGTIVWFSCAPSRRASHEHRDNNAFALYHRKPLIVDAGFYDYWGSPHWKNYYSRTIAHNTICIFDSSERFMDAGSVVSNDGGQIESPQMAFYEDIFKPSNQRGKWIAHSEEDEIVYNAADAALSYDTSKINKFTRRMLYEKPDRITILDHVVLKHTNLRQREAKWIVHAVNKPVMSGAFIQSVVDNHIEQYAAGSYSIVNGNGKAEITTFLPESARATLVGGDGYEYWVNGVNYPPNPLPDTVLATPGKWRIEVSPANISDSVVFLHSIISGDTGSVLASNGLYVRSASACGIDYGDALHLFSAKGETSLLALSLDSLSGNRTITLVAADLMATASYKIKYGSSEWIVVTDSGGVLKKTVTIPGGKWPIHILHESVGVPSNYSCVNTRGIDVFPNPFNPQTRFTITGAVENGELMVFSVAGRKIREWKLSSGTNKQTVTWDGLDQYGNPVSSGFYRIILKSSGRMAGKTVVLVR